jgi:hypothetical protein
MGSALRHWKATVHCIIQIEHQEANEKLNMQRSITYGLMSTTKFLKSTNCRKLGRAFGKWHNNVLLIMERARQQCLHLLSMLESTVNMKMRLSWRKWLCVVQLCTRRRDSLQKLVVRLLYMSLRAAYGRWRSFLVSVKEQELTWKVNGRLLVSVLRKLVGSLKCSGWMRWRAIHMHLVDCEKSKIRATNTLFKFFSRLSRLEVSMGFRSWRQYVSGSIAREVKVLKHLTVFVKVRCIIHSYIILCLIRSLFYRPYRVKMIYYSAEVSVTCIVSVLRSVLPS